MNIPKDAGWEGTGCLLCSSTGRLPVLSAPGDGAEAIKLVRCTECGLVYMNPRPTLAAMRRLYDQVYYSHAASPLGSYQGFKGRLIRQLAASHYGYAHLGDGRRAGAAMGWPAQLVAGKWLKVPPWVPDGRLLDVGCGNGDYLLAMAQLGWKVSGTEISAKAAAYAQSRGLDVMVGEMQDVRLPEDSFEVVTLWDVLEHLHQPVAALREARRLLTADGMILIGTPSIVSTAFGLFDRGWHGLHLPYHLSLFSPQTLEAALRFAGFEIVALQTYTSPHGLANDVRSWISRQSGISIHTLYRFGSRFDLALLPLVAALDLVVRGDNMVAWARKVRDHG